MGWPRASGQQFFLPKTTSACSIKFWCSYCTKQFFFFFSLEEDRLDDDTQPMIYGMCRGHFETSPSSSNEAMRVGLRVRHDRSRDAFVGPWAKAVEIPHVHGGAAVLVCPHTRCKVVVELDLIRVNVVRMARLHRACQTRRCRTQSAVLFGRRECLGKPCVQAPWGQRQAARAKESGAQDVYGSMPSRSTSTSRLHSCINCRTASSSRTRPCASLSTRRSLAALRWGAEAACCGIRPSAIGVTTWPGLQPCVPLS